MILNVGPCILGKLTVKILLQLEVLLKDEVLLLLVDELALVTHLLELLSLKFSGLFTICLLSFDTIL